MQRWGGVEIRITGAYVMIFPDGIMPRYRRRIRDWKLDVLFKSETRVTNGSIEMFLVEITNAIVKSFEFLIEDFMYSGDYSIGFILYLAIAM
ncbi:unnamed protein product [Pieris macdunnoughi]|uniref:Uncharacterized protein n=1 Tax=Pieris macdunnoughi TaxID=345717 RepID=A0A821WJA7_9NEOP|nr:unnamed protein product [Pieris macdunnoughi]